MWLPTLGVKIANDGKSETDINSGIAQVKQVYFMRKKSFHGKPVWRLENR